jgi:uncharacterized membrane protein (DUF373 family)
MSVSTDGQQDPAVPAPGSDDAGQGRGQAPRTPMALSVWLLEHTQDIISVLIGLVLLVLAGTVLTTGIIQFAHALGSSSSGGIAAAAQTLLDRALFVLILIEIVHTVVLSLQTHRLIAQPFVVVGLVAVIRRILLLLSSTAGPVDHTELGLLIAMVAVFVAGLIAVSRFEVRGDEHDQI